MVGQVVKSVAHHRLGLPELACRNAALLPTGSTAIGLPTGIVTLPGFVEGGIACPKTPE